MKRLVSGTAVALVALVAAGIAVAHGVDGGKSVRAVAGTFTATTASRVTTRTCTTSDGKTVVSSDGMYAGSSTGDPDLTGPVTLHARSTINTTDGVGALSGSLKVDVASGRDTTAQFTAVYSGGQAAGLAVGHAHSPAAQLVANVSAAFSASGGFTNGKIGGSAGGSAVEIAPAKCPRQTVVKEVSDAKGIVSAVSSTSITVAGLTCTVPAALQSRLSGVTVGSRAEIRCRLTSGVNTLESIKSKR